MGAGDNNGALGIRLSIEAVLGQLSDTLTGIKDTMDKLHKFMTPNPVRSPIVRPLAGTGVSDGSTYFIIDLGGPISGRRWDVRRVSQWKGGGVDPFVAVSGVNVILAKVPAGSVVNKGLTLSQLVILDMVAAPQQCPNDAEYSTSEFTVNYLEHVAVIFKGTSNLDQYVVTGQAVEYLESMRADLEA